MTRFYEQVDSVRGSLHLDDGDKPSAKMQAASSPDGSPCMVLTLGDVYVFLSPYQAYRLTSSMVQALGWKLEHNEPELPPSQVGPSAFPSELAHQP